jgi:rRNA maturation endonuclease Nob1
MHTTTNNRGNRDGISLYDQLTMITYLEERGIITRNNRHFPKCTTCRISYPDLPQIKKCIICGGSVRHVPRKKKNTDKLRIITT